MKPSQTIFCKDDETVTLSLTQYNKLVEYKKLALEMKAIWEGDSE